MKYVVGDEHTLGIQRGNSIEVLIQLISRGADFETHPEPKDISQFNEIRGATVADFYEFRAQVPPDFEK